MEGIISKLCYTDEFNHSYLPRAGMIKSDAVNLYIKNNFGEL